MGARVLAGFTARRDIAVGEELSITYITMNQPKTARISELQDIYFFVCSCIRCVADLSKDGKTKEKLSYQRSASALPQKKPNHHRAKIRHGH